jgi:hypothetical protein
MFASPTPGPEKQRQRRHLRAVFPFKGYGALLIAMMGLGGCIAILCAANNSPVTNWTKTAQPRIGNHYFKRCTVTVTPNVLLSIMMVVINTSVQLPSAVSTRFP